MDATTAPHRIPPEMPQYGEANHIFEMMQNMLQQLLIHQPEDPIPFMINYFQQDNDNGATLKAFPPSELASGAAKRDWGLRCPTLGFRSPR